MEPRNKKPEACYKCGRSEPEVRFITRKNEIGQVYWVLYCRRCKADGDNVRRKARRAELRQSDPEGFYRQNRDWQLRIKYKITLEQYIELFKKQDNRCAICGVDDRKSPYLYDMPVDHNHKTGEVRAILCHRCNHMIGKAGDDPGLLRRGAIYLERHYG
jgi:hypothetical protein